MNPEQLRNQLIADPIRYVPAWTVAAFDPTIGELPRRKMDKSGMALYLKNLEEAGAPGVLLAASTGWGHARNFQEHTETLLAGSAVHLGKVVKQALVRIEDPLEDNIQLLKQLYAWGYGIVWTRRGSQLPPDASDEAVADNMLPLVKAAAEIGLPVGIYSISTVDGAPLRVGAAKILLEKLGDLAKQVVAVKITEPDFDTSTLTYLQDAAFANKKIVQGWDAFYARAMQEGLCEDGTNHCGATSGAAACMVHLYRAMHEAASAKEWDRLETLQGVLSEVFYSMQGPDKNLFPDLQTAKWVMGLGHPLTEDRGGENAKPLLAKLEELSTQPEKKEAFDLVIKSLLLMKHYRADQMPYLEQLEGY